MCNRLIEDSIDIKVEPMDYKALMKRSKKTERQEKESSIRQKDGTVKTIHKHKRKKRFGHSINLRAPSMFLAILQRKISQYGGSYTEINRNDVKASQYNHDTNTFEKIPLSQRNKEVAGHTVQRDLYSSFLIQHTFKNGNRVNRKSCIKDFNRFIEMHDGLLLDMQMDGISCPQCFGF